VQLRLRRDLGERAVGGMDGEQVDPGLDDAVAG